MLRKWNKLKRKRYSFYIYKKLEISLSIIFSITKLSRNVHVYHYISTSVGKELLTF